MKKIMLWFVQFEGALEAKGERLTNGILTSTNYPNGYPNNEDHTQTIRVPEGNTIRIEFLDLKIPPGEPDLVTVTDEDGTELAHLEARGERFFIHSNVESV